MSQMPSDQDEGLFQHQPGTHYLHLLREVIVTYRQFLRQLAGELGLSVAQLELLRQLALSGGRATTSSLARDLNVDPAAVTRLVAGLEKLGVLARESDARDGRRRPVVLAESGRRQMLALHARLHEREAALSSELDKASVETTMRVLQTIRQVSAKGVLR